MKRLVALLILLWNIAFPHKCHSAASYTPYFWDAAASVYRQGQCDGAGVQKTTETYPDAFQTHTVTVLANASIAANGNATSIPFPASSIDSWKMFRVINTSSQCQIKVQVSYDGINYGYVMNSVTANDTLKYQINLSTGSPGLWYALTTKEGAPITAKNCKLQVFNQGAGAGADTLEIIGRQH